MLTLSCPSCGAEVKFHSKASVFAVCSYCKATLVRQDMNLEAIGKMAELQDDLTPLQIGTTGSYNGKHFEIIGRLKVRYDEGYWNEWYITFGGETTGWLAEAQGFYAVCFAVPTREIHAPDANKIRVRLEVLLGSAGDFTVTDIRQATCEFSEGELPLYASQGKESKSVDLSGPQDGMATLEYAPDGVRAYTGHYLDFDELNFRNLRKIDGW